MRKQIGILVIVISWALCLPLLSFADSSSDQLEFFEKNIRPVLAERCYECHSGEAKSVKGGLLLDSKEGTLKGGDSGHPAIVPGNVDASRLITAISYRDPDLQMPPAKAGGKLPDQVITNFIAWVKMGAPDPRTNNVTNELAAQRKANAEKHWAFQRVKNVAPPAVESRWAKTPIDQFILAKLKQQGMTPSEPADKRTLIRRAYFDLIGLPPTYEEVEAFIRDKSPDAFAKVIDRLLDSPQYGVRWGRYWLDVARYADTKGYVYGDREETKFVHSAAYRDWVVKSLNDDIPYDRFLKLQIAADQVEDAQRDDLAAMGYLTLGRRFLGVVHDIIDDRIDVVMRGTQALTVGCARCHDHKFDPIPTRDYYSLYGIFSGSSERTVALSGGSNAKAYLDFERELQAREEKFRTAFEAKREEQSKRFRDKTPEYLMAVLDVKNIPTEEFYSFIAADEVNPVVVRAWHSYLLNTAKSFHPVWKPWHDFAALTPAEFNEKSYEVLSALTGSTNKVNFIVLYALRGRPPRSMRDVAELYGIAFEEVVRKWEAAKDKTTALTKEEEELRQVLYASDSPARVPSGAIVDLEWYFDEPTRVELTKLASQMDRWIVQAPGAPPYAVILEDRPVQKIARVFKRGNPANKGEEVPRQFLEVLSGPERKSFEKGSGRLELANVIASKDNPLTARVAVNRIWSHHFGAGLVRTPSDFGTRAEPPTHPELLDWLANRFMQDGWSQKKLHRMIMLSAVYQQQSDAASSNDRNNGKDPENKFLAHFNRRRLDFESVRDSLLYVSGQLNQTIGGKAEELFKPPFSKRRSIYGFVDRQFLPGAYRIFDFANPDMHNPQRAETTIPQQALFFMNGAFVAEQARALAARVNGTNSLSKNPERVIEEMYKIAFQREPTTKQTKLAVSFLKSAEADVIEESKKDVRSAWQYGWGEFDEAMKTLKSFSPLPYFTGEAWQGGIMWPDGTLGWLQLTATGGHAGNDFQHAVIRRWVSPVDGTVTISGPIKHERAAGQGIRALVLSSRHGVLGNWVLHNKAADVKLENLAVKKGDTIDFIVSINESLNSNDFVWSPVVEMVGPTAIRDANGYAKKWDAQKEFGGPPSGDRTPLTALEKYAQVLLLANEFLFVD